LEWKLFYSELEWKKLNKAKVRVTVAKPTVPQSSSKECKKTCCITISRLPQNANGDSE
jgi:hypothetical protein